MFSPLRTYLALEVYPVLRCRTVQILFPVLIASVACARVALAPVLTLPTVQPTPPVPVDTRVSLGGRDDQLARQLLMTDGVVTITSGG